MVALEKGSRDAAFIAHLGGCLAIKQIGLSTLRVRLSVDSLQGVSSGSDPIQPLSTL